MLAWLIAQRSARHTNPFDLRPFTQV